MHSKALVETHLFSHMAKSLDILGLSHAGQIQARPGVTWPHLARPGQARPGLDLPGAAQTLYIKRFRHMAKKLRLDESF